MLIGVPLETAAGRNPRGRHARDGQEAQGPGPHAARAVGRRRGRQRHRCGLRRPPAPRSPTRAGAFGADLVLKVRTPVDGELRADEARRRRWSACSTPSTRDGLQRLADGRPDRLRARSRAAHHARAEHGRAVLAGQHRRLQGRDDRRRQVPALLPDADDRRRHREGRARGDPGRRRGRPAGHRHRQAPGRGDRGLRRAP